MLKWPSNTRLKLVEATVMFILHFPVFFNIAFQNIKTTLISLGSVPSCLPHILIVPAWNILVPFIQFHRPSLYLWDGCRLAQSLSSLTPFRAAHLSLVSGTCCCQCFKAGMMLMGPQLCPVITAQSKRGLEPPWEVPVGEGRSKSVFISSGACLLALDPLTEDSKCFSLSSVIPDGAVVLFPLFPLGWSAAGRQSSGWAASAL